MVAKIEPGTAAAQQNAGATPLKCPRCDSANTKFCYYNNYSLTQPRHFCKSCKRYWTRGGTLRNVPVGGGSRKNKRTKKHHRSAASEPAAPSLPSPGIVRSAPPTDLSSLLYGLPAINSETVFLPKFDFDAQFSGYEGTFQSCLGTNLEDLHKSAPAPKEFLRNYTLLSSQIPSSSSMTKGFQPLLSYDELPIGIFENNSSDRSTQWKITKQTPLEAVNSFAAPGAAAAVADSSYTFWNQAVSGGWPESGSSAAPLF